MPEAPQVDEIQSKERYLHSGTAGPVFPRMGGQDPEILGPEPCFWKNILLVTRGAKSLIFEVGSVSSYVGQYYSYHLLRVHI